MKRLSAFLFATSFILMLSFNSFATDWGPPGHDQIEQHDCVKAINPTVMVLAVVLMDVITSEVITACTNAVQVDAIDQTAETEIEPEQLIPVRHDPPDSNINRNTSKNYSGIFPAIKRE